MKKTSQDWMTEFGDMILDPDGWDRSNFDQSWNELITREEYISRRTQSTTQSTCSHQKYKPSDDSLEYHESFGG
jgi:hypothetical protein